MPVGDMIRWRSRPSAPSGSSNMPVMGVSIDPGETGVPSTKGVLGG